MNVRRVRWLAATLGAVLAWPAQAPASSPERYWAFADRRAVELEARWDAATTGRCAGSRRA